MHPYDDHLSRLRETSRETDTTLAILLPAQRHAGEVVSAAWEILFDHLCEKEKTATLDELNTASAVIYKLAQSGHHLKTLEHKTLEFEDQRARLRSAAATLTQQPGLPAEVRAEIERDLRLLN